MPWRPHGRAEVDPSAPRAWATCDRCGFNYNHYRLTWDLEWSGPKVINRRFLVCETCNDDLQPQLRTIFIPPDPPPIFNARVEPYTIDETDYRVTQDGNRRITQDGNPRVIQSG